MIGNNQSTNINTALQVKNLFVNITDYPNFVRGQGGTGDIQYSDEVSSTTEDVDVVLLHYKTKTNYPNTTGKLIRVWYEVGFQLKAANDSADLIYQLQGRDEDGTWIDMCAAVTCTDIDTTWVTKLIQGYMDIQSGADALPFEMRLIFQSNESSTDVLISFTCTWSNKKTVSNNPRAMLQLGDNLYVASENTLWYTTGDDTFTQMTFTAKGYRFGVSDCKVTDTDKIYIATDGKVYELTGTTWSEITGSPSNCRSLVHFGTALFAGMTTGEIRKTENEVTWTTCGSAGTSAINWLIEFNSELYAASSDGIVYKWNGTTTWAEVAGGDITAGELLCLCVHGTSLYVGASNAGSYNTKKVYVLNAAGDTWTDTGTFPNYVEIVFGLISYGDILYAACGSNADVNYWDTVTSAWLHTTRMSGDSQVLSIAAYDKNTTLYAGTTNYGYIYRATITATFESGEGIGRVKNDDDGQETKFQIVGRIL